MTEQEYQEFSCIQKVNIMDLQLIKPEGTLLFGYTSDDDSYHIYVKDNLIHRYIYSETESLWYRKDSELILNNLFVFGNLSVLPAYSDYNFCAFLIRKGISILFNDHGRRNNFNYSNMSLYYGKCM